MKLKTHNNRIQLTVKSVTFFAKQKSAPLFTSADAGVMFKSHKIETEFLSEVVGL